MRSLLGAISNDVEIGGQVVAFIRQDLGVRSMPRAAFPSESACRISGRSLLLLAHCDSLDSRPKNGPPFDFLPLRLRGVTYEEALNECERRNAGNKFIEHIPREAKPGVWSWSSRLRPDWRSFSSSDRLDDPVRAGERFRAKADIEVAVMTHWRAPFTGGDSAVLPAGTVVVASHDQLPSVPGFSCVPEDYDELERKVVPEEDRSAGKYGGYSLSFVLDDIGPKLEPLP
ncbi:MAG: hypothetical protein ACLP8S_18470 [Solirubrobacteraceae bacterium]